MQMVRFEGFYKTAVEVTEYLQEIGYEYKKDFAWSVNIDENQVTFVAIPPVETLLALKFNTAIIP